MGGNHTSSAYWLVLPILSNFRGCYSGEKPSLWEMASTDPAFGHWVCHIVIPDLCPFGKEKGKLSVQSLNLRLCWEKGKKKSS